MKGKYIQSAWAVPQKANKLSQLIPKYYNKDTNKLMLYQMGDGWVQVINFRDWSFISSLQVQNCGVDDTMIDQICKKQWPNMCQLTLGKNKLSKIGVKKLMNLKWPWIQSLILAKNPIGNQGFKEIFDNKTHKFIKLSLSGCGITSIDCLLKIVQPKQLKTLHIDKNMIGNRGAKMLAKAALPFLSCVTMESCDIGDEGVKCLVKSQFKPKYLNIRYNRITYEGYSKISGLRWVECSSLQAELRKSFIAYLNICSSNLVKFLEIGNKINSYLFVEDFSCFKNDFSKLKQKTKKENGKCSLFQQD